MPHQNWWVMRRAATLDIHQAYGRTSRPPENGQLRMLRDGGYRTVELELGHVYMHSKLNETMTKGEELIVRLQGPVVL